MNTTNEDTKSEAAKLFMRDHEAAAFIGRPRRGRPRRRFTDEFEAIRYLVGVTRLFGALGVVTDDGAVLWRLDWLLGERAKRRLSLPELLRNRNTQQINRVRADGKIYPVKQCRDVLVGQNLLS